MCNPDLTRPRAAFPTPVGDDLKVCNSDSYASSTLVWIFPHRALRLSLCYPTIESVAPVPAPARVRGTEATLPLSWTRSRKHAIR